MGSCVPTVPQQCANPPRNCLLLQLAALSQRRCCRVPVSNAEPLKRPSDRRVPQHGLEERGNCLFWRSQRCSLAFLIPCYELLALFSVELLYAHVGFVLAMFSRAIL